MLTLVRKSWLGKGSMVVSEEIVEGRVLRTVAQLDDRRLTCWNALDFDLTCQMNLIERVLRADQIEANNEPTKRAVCRG